MIYSMTGFATAAAELDAGSLTLEIRAVNHRYLDLQLRVPDELRALEPALREARRTVRRCPDEKGDQTANEVLVHDEPPSKPAQFRPSLSTSACKVIRAR